MNNYVYMCFTFGEVYIQAELLEDGLQDQRASTYVFFLIEG